MQACSNNARLWLPGHEQWCSASRTSCSSPGRFSTGLRVTGQQPGQCSCHVPLLPCVLQVLQEESDPEGRKTVGGALSTLVLELLQVLTATWPPPTLRPLFLQLLRAPGSAQLMPSAESVAAPTPMLAVGRCGSSMHSTQQEHSQKQQHPEQLGSGAAHDSHAEAAVHELLQLLEACGAMSWQQLPCTGSAAAGAGLAVLYSSIMGGQQDVDVLAPPTDAQQAIQVGRCQQQSTGTREDCILHCPVVFYEALSALRSTCLDISSHCQSLLPHPVRSSFSSVNAVCAACMPLVLCHRGGIRGQHAGNSQGPRPAAVGCCTRPTASAHQHTP